MYFVWDFCQDCRPVIIWFGRVHRFCLFFAPCHTAYISLLFYFFYSLPLFFLYLLTEIETNFFMPGIYWKIGSTAKAHVVKSARRSHTQMHTCKVTYAIYIHTSILSVQTYVHTFMCVDIF